MRRIPIRLAMYPLLLALASTAAFAGEASGCDTRPEALRAVEAQWGRALRESDTVALSRLLADDYVDTSETGHRAGKADVVGALAGGALRIRRLELESMTIVIRGTTAVVAGNATQAGTIAGKTLPRHVAFTDSFACVRGAWLILAAHRSVIR